jgi:biopolymer transport protein ExbB/TolQ
MASPDPIRRWLYGLVASICLIIIPPLLGMGGTVLGMIGAFKTLGESSESGIGDPAALSADISFALVTTAVGLILSLFGFVLFIVTLIGLIRARNNANEQAPPPL